MSLIVQSYIEFSFSSTLQLCPLQFSVNILGESFLQFYMCYPAYILHVLNYYLVFYIMTDISGIALGCAYSIAKRYTTRAGNWCIGDVHDEDFYPRPFF